MKRRAGRNYQEENTPDMDCGTCVRKNECDRRAEGSFCTRWRGSEPEPKGTDPNQAWRRGEPVDF